MIVFRAERSLCIRHVRPSCTQDGHFGEVTLLRAKRSLGCEESDRSATRTITFYKVIVLRVERSLWFEESDRFAHRTITLYKVIVLNSERSLFVHIRGFAVTDARGGERCADRTHTYRYVVGVPPGYRPGDVPTGCAPTTGRCRLPGIGRECSFIVCCRV